MQKIFKVVIEVIDREFEFVVKEFMIGASILEESNEVEAACGHVFKSLL